MIIPDMPMAEYQAREEVSSHDLKLIHRAPFAYRFAKDNPEPEDETMGIGSLLHLAVLEPEQVEAQVAILPEDAMPKPTAPQLKAIKAGKGSPNGLARLAWWDDWNESSKGKLNVKPSDLVKVTGMHKSLMATPTVRTAISSTGIREASCFFDLWDVACRMRPDHWGDDEVMMDLKSTGDCSREAFSREIWKQRYHAQMSFYDHGATQLGRKPRLCVWIAVETKPPFLCSYHIASISLLEFGRIENTRDLATFKKCSQSGFWPGVRTYPEPIELPAYAS